MKDYVKYKESSYHKCQDVKNLCVWAMNQKLPLGRFKWIEDTSSVNKNFIENQNEYNSERYFFEIDIRIHEQKKKKKKKKMIPKKTCST